MALINYIYYLPLINYNYLQQTLVNTIETTRIRYFLDLLVDKKKAIMLVGAAGTGKSVIINDKLKSLSNDLYAVANVPLNFYTTSGTYTIKTKFLHIQIIIFMTGGVH